MFVLRFRKGALLDALAGAGPIVLITLMNTLNFYSDRWFASLLRVGQVSILSYAWRFEPIIVGGIGGAIAAPLLTELSESIAKKDIPGAKRHMMSAVRMLSLTVIPTCVLLMLFSREVISIIYLRGAFRPSDADELAIVLRIITIALLIWSFGVAVNQYFFAMKRWRFVAIITSMGVLGNIIADVFLVKPFGVVGLALATTLTTIPLNVWLWGVVYKELRLGSHDMRGFALELSKSLLFMVAAGLLGRQVLGLFRVNVVISSLVQLLFAGLVYLAAAWKSRIQEIFLIRQRLSSFFRT